MVPGMGVFEPGGVVQPHIVGRVGPRGRPDRFRLGDSARPHQDLRAPDTADRAACRAPRRRQRPPRPGRRPDAVSLHLHGAWDPWDPGSTERHAEPLDGPLCREVARLAAGLNVWLVPGSILERAESGVIYNTMVVFTPTGELAASYRKVFPWRPVETCEPGAEFVTVPIGDVGTVGLTVCYDAWFPEVSRQLSWMGPNFY